MTWKMDASGKNGNTSSVLFYQSVFIVWLAYTTELINTLYKLKMFGFHRSSKQYVMETGNTAPRSAHSGKQCSISVFYTRVLACMFCASCIVVHRTSIDGSIEQYLKAAVYIAISRLVS